MNAAKQGNSEVDLAKALHRLTRIRL